MIVVGMTGKPCMTNKSLLLQNIELLWSPAACSKASPPGFSFTMRKMNMDTLLLMNINTQH